MTQLGGNSLDKQVLRSDPPTGDAGFRALFDSVLPDLHRYVARSVAPAEVDDVTAEILGAVYARWNIAPDNLIEQRKWVFAFAVNKLREFHRHRTQGASLIGRLGREQRESYSFDEIIAGTDRVNYLLSKLPEKEREVVLLSVFMGFTGAEVAEILSISATAVTTRAARARKHLKDLIKSEE